MQTPKTAALFAPLSLRAEQSHGLQRAAAARRPAGGGAARSVGRFRSFFGRILRSQVTDQFERVFPAPM